MMYDYNRECLSEVMENLGTMMEYIVYSVGLESEQFLKLFIASGIAREIENGNPKYTVGMSGIELAQEVLYKIYGKSQKGEMRYYQDKSPEYWGMWALAYYQNYKKKSYDYLLEVVGFHEILGLYPALHQADILKFVDVMEEKIELHRQDAVTNLARLRRLRGYSQRILAQQSGVSLRMIQLYEQKQNDINKAQGETLLQLAKTLNCSMEQLMNP